MSVQPQPLPFDPATIPGLSEKLLRSHHANNYTGAVKRLNALRGELAAFDPASAPGYLWNGLKREELICHRRWRPLQPCVISIFRHVPMFPPGKPKNQCNS